MKEIIVALITSGLGLIGVIITVMVNTKKSNAQVIAELRRMSDASDAKLDKEISILRTELNELTREVRMHNNFATRVPVLEKEVENLKEQIKG